MRRHRLAVGFSLMVLCAMALAADPPAKTEKPAEAPPAARVVFAVPFENATGQEQYDPAATGMGDLIAIMLAQQENIKVVERQRLDALTAEQALALKGLTGNRYAVTAGKLLQADTVVTGRLFLVEGKLTVSAQVLDIATERVAAAEQLSTRPEHLVEGALQLARSLARQMAMPLPQIDPDKIDKSPVASLHFAKALSHYYAGNMDAAIMQFMRAVDLDPDYAEAHYWQARCYLKQNEDAHAIIELEAFLKGRPNSKHAPEARKMLDEAVEREKHSLAPRLDPPTPEKKPSKE